MTLRPTAPPVVWAPSAERASIEPGWLYGVATELAALRFEDNDALWRWPVTDLDDEFLAVAEVASILKLNQQTIRNWIDQSSLAALRVVVAAHASFEYEALFGTLERQSRMCNAVWNGRPRIAVTLGKLFAECRM